MAYLKTETPSEVLETLRQLEAQADECWRTLQILQNPSNVAIWALLTAGIRMVEREHAVRGSNTPHFDAMLANLGRLLTIALKWTVGHGQPAASPLERSWTHELISAVDQALSVAARYSHFEVCFQGFHKNRYAVDVVSPTSLRFTVPGSGRDRQVSAYQKGHRPREGRFAGRRAAQQPQNPRVKEGAERVILGCLQTSARSFEYGDPWDLWREMLPEYRERVTALARRADSLSLGHYRLDEFNAFYTALIAICAAHDFLCFRWGQVSGIFPIESTVMVRSEAQWIDILSALSGIGREKCQVMISDLTFSVTRSVDLHVYPLIPLDGAHDAIAIAPPFVLHSRHDENILRVCSQRRPQVYDVTSLEKQAEMLTATRNAGARYGADGPIQLPPPNPDIDLLAVDESCSTVLIAELKWIRKTVRPLEIPDRDADVLKGVGQLETIRGFVRQHAAHLSVIGRLPRSLDAYEHVYYLLVARDHWRWTEPDDRGSLSTIHANTAEQALSRFAHCVLTANVGLPHASTREAIGFAIHLVAHIARDGGQRRVTQLVAVRGYDARTDTFSLETRYAQPLAEGQESGAWIPSAGLH